MKQANAASTARPAALLHAHRGSGAKVRTEEQRRAAAERKRRRLDVAIARPLPDVGFVTKVDVLARLKVSDRTLRYWIEQGRVPQPVRLSERVLVWPVEQVRALLDRLGAESRAEVAEHA